MKPSILQLEGYYVKGLRFDATIAETDTSIYAHPNFHLVHQDIDKLPPLTTEVKSEARVNESDTHRWRVEIAVESKNSLDNGYPYTFRILLVGHFRISSAIAADKVEALARMLGTAFLYSVAREALLSATGRGPYPAIVLPVVTFQGSPIVKPPDTETAESRTPQPPGTE
ncbi:MAG: protein-export chaperone SecB [Blastocatellia bacterium]